MDVLDDGEEDEEDDESHGSGDGVDKVHSRLHAGVGTAHEDNGTVQLTEC